MVDNNSCFVAESTLKSSYNFFVLLYTVSLALSISTSSTQQLETISPNKYNKEMNQN